MSLDPEAQEVGQRMQALSARAGLAPEELARRSGLSIKAIACLEQSRGRAPRITTLNRLARALGLTLHQLISELFPPP